MFTVDNPMLALITRFVAGQAPLDLRDTAFGQTQIAAIQQHLAQFPYEERNARAIEWIERYAEGYRRAWQAKAVCEHARQARCPDCPLAGEDTHCAIHDRWLELLHSYLAGEIASHRYVKDTLRLLNEHKTQLKQVELPARHRVRQHIGAGTAGSPPSRP